MAKIINVDIEDALNADWLANQRKIKKGEATHDDLEGDTVETPVDLEDEENEGG